jgi:hypothetical protein
VSRDKVWYHQVDDDFRVFLGVVESREEIEVMLFSSCVPNRGTILTIVYRIAKWNLLVCI